MASSSSAPAATAAAAASASMRSQASKLLVAGDPERSKLVLDASVQADPSDLQSRLMLTQVCIQLGPATYEQGLSSARQALALSSQVSPEDPREAVSCRIALAVVLGILARQPHLPESSRQRHRSEAIQVLQGGEPTTGPAPAPPPAPAPASALTALLHYNLAVLLAEDGSTEQALRYARSALKACSGAAAATAAVSVLAPAAAAAAAGPGPQQQQLCTLALILLALLTSTRQQPQAALQLLSAAPSSPSPSSPPHPSDLLLTRLKAQLLHVHLGDTAAAMAELARLKLRLSGHRGAEAAGLGQMAAEMWQELALVCAASSDSQEAGFCMDQALQLAPWQARTHQVLGQVYEASGRVEEAMEAYSTALALEPRDAATLLSMGTLYQRRGSVADLSLARDLLQDALRYRPACPAAWYRLGLVCRGLGHRKEAEQNLRTAVALAAQSPALPFADCPLLLQV